MQAEELLRQGRLGEAVEALQSAVRASPADAKLRVFLFQLLSVVGQWDKARTQLKVAGELDAANLLMVQVYGSALDCEAERKEVFAGRRSPTVFGEPQEWVGWLIQANQLSSAGQPGPARELRDRAFESAPAVPGTVGHATGDAKAGPAVGEQPFEWIADGDSRLGPVLEAVIEGRYYWVPLMRVREVRLEAPSSLRDAVWMPVQFLWTNGGFCSGLIPTRYPDSEQDAGPAIRLAKATGWRDRGEGYFVGLGQRVLATDESEYGIMDVRHIRLQAEGPSSADIGTEGSDQQAGTGPAAQGAGDG